MLIPATESVADAERRCLEKSWSYPFVLPSGKRLQSAHSGEFDSISQTRWQMVEAAIHARFGGTLPPGLSAIDIACHQGWFSTQLAKSGFARVTGYDARAGHVTDARLVATAMALKNASFEQSDVHALTRENAGMHDVVLCLGLIYHLENPVGALRVARALCRNLCFVETQVAPGLSGWMDFGSHRFVRPMQGSFALIDETEDTHGPEASTLGICLVPSLEGLLWILGKVGFARAEVLPVPEDGHEQLAHHKRVMVAAFV